MCSNSSNFSFRQKGSYRRGSMYKDIIYYMDSFTMVSCFCLCTPIDHILLGKVGPEGERKTQNTPFNSNPNNHREMKLVPINMDHCLLQFDPLKFFLGIFLHGGSLPIFNFFNENSKFFNEIVKFTSQIA